MLNLCSGFILLLSGALEGLASIAEGVFDVPFRLHHGIALFGFIEMIKALPDVMKGLKFIDDGEKTLLAGSTGWSETAGTAASTG